MSRMTTSTSFVPFYSIFLCALRRRTIHSSSISSVEKKIFQVKSAKSMHARHLRRHATQHIQGFGLNDVALDMNPELALWVKRRFSIGKGLTEVRLSQSHRLNIRVINEYAKPSHHARASTVLISFPEIFKNTTAT